MSGAMENRAAVFTSEPQDVEVYQRGAWRPGALLGWRHGRDGSCEMWVRTGAEEIWLALDAVRLPEPEPQRHLTLAASTDTPAAPAPSELTATLNLFAVRDLLSDGDAAARVPAPRSGGRRRAPETDGQGMVAAGRGEPARSVNSVATAAPSGRHRAPGDAGSPGRHRAADTGFLPVVRDDEWPARTGQVASALRAEPDVELYTRPMRLVDQASQSRRPRWDGAPAGVPPLR